MIKSSRGQDESGPLIYLSAQYIQAKEYLEAIVGSTSDAIVTTDLRGRVIYFSPGAEVLYGVPYHEALGLPVWKLYAEGKDEARSIQRRLLTTGTLADYETVIRTQDERCVHVSMSASLLRDSRGRVIGTLGISKDITRRVDLERRLRELSITDNLTGLFNQRHFHERAAVEVERARRQGQQLSMLLIDLDHFKAANDEWGHLEGDRILRETAAIIKINTRRSVDAAFRYGGDEFIALFPGLGKRQAENVARRIRAASLKKDYARIVTLSIGVASLQDTDSVTDLTARADSRMYASKKRRKKARHTA
jgi:diguanylate cyclase (GGDEF)-like protein/PAS domain S-box-containing protein